MTYALVTIVAPLPIAQLETAQTRIEALANPARPDIQHALDQLDAGDGTHFCSLHAIRSKGADKAYLAFEFSADGTPEQATARIARAIGTDLATVFSLAADWQPGDIANYLLKHRISIGVGLFDNPGLPFAGTPGRSVGRIRAEQRLAAAARDALPRPDAAQPALDRLNTLRATLARDPAMRDLLEVGPADPPFEPQSIATLVAGLLASFIATYLWPILLVAVFLGGYATVTAPSFGAGLDAAWGALWTTVLVVLVLAGLLYASLRSLEERDSLEERTADRETLDAMFQRENQLAQNHMLSITERKPGLVRWLTLHLIFWIIGELATRLYKPGHLSEIGTIHFARWVTVPGTRDLLFFSNYDASWESYLEDFITKAHQGLTGVWSNAIGFPRTNSLVLQGATDGERFKRFARQSMIPTRFWYSAYPTLSTDEIRTNSAIRLGLAGALTEDEAARWFALFGSAARPDAKLVSSEIQSLVFGGLGNKMPAGVVRFFDLPDDVAQARSWLAAILPGIAFDDGRRLERNAITLALGPDGLRRLGLPQEGLDTFPYAFRTGITDPSRGRMLGDVGDNDRTNWRWGGARTPDVALLLYGEDPHAVAELEARVDAAPGGIPVHRTPLRDADPAGKEPFGFADGISQPVIQGTYKALRGVDPIHLVQPGEFILGYPDNRGNTPPGPTLPALADPGNQLPLVPTAPNVAIDFATVLVDGLRDLGRNGSFLVIRELEQDTNGFDQYCKHAADHVAGCLPDPYKIDDKFIAAKLVGRWQNGSSLARHPYAPFKQPEPHPEADGHAHGDTERTLTTPEAAGSIAAPAPIPRPAKPSHGRDNDFLFGAEDPEALRCPFGAHIRRANPRDSLEPGSKDQIDISNRHRILRVGRQFQPKPGDKPGLMFMCFNADLERQFEFVQQTWLRSPSFHGLTNERDPLLGEGDAGTCGFTIPTRYGPLRLPTIPALVTTRGGGYFFLPGKRLLRFLVQAP